MRLSLSLSLPGYTDRRRNNDNDSTTYQTEDTNGKSSETSRTDQNRKDTIHDDHLYSLEDQQTFPRNNYNNRYPNSRGYRGNRGGNYRYHNNNAAEFYDENNAVDEQSATSAKPPRQNTSSNGHAGNDRSRPEASAPTSETVNGNGQNNEPKEQRTAKPRQHQQQQPQQQSNGVS
jgi:hypothetical protein